MVYNRHSINGIHCCYNNIVMIYCCCYKGCPKFSDVKYNRLHIVHYGTCHHPPPRNTAQTPQMSHIYALKHCINNIV